MDSRLPRLGQANGDRLLGRSGAVLAAANVLDLFAHELAGLGLGRLSFPPGLMGPGDGSLFRHDGSPFFGIHRLRLIVCQGRYLPDSSSDIRLMPRALNDKSKLNAVSPEESFWHVPALSSDAA